MLSELERLKSNDLGLGDVPDELIEQMRQIALTDERAVQLPNHQINLPDFRPLRTMGMMVTGVKTVTFQWGDGRSETSGERHHQWLAVTDKGISALKSIFEDFASRYYEWFGIDDATTKETD